jgi:metal-sulfur cluster biosynthetic enzyme
VVWAELAADSFDLVSDALREVIDPEIGVNIYDLGLIYALGWDDEVNTLVIEMTLTSAGCPLQEVLTETIGEALQGVVDGFRINWVWMPPWDIRRITEEGREMMRAIGLNI